MITYLIRIFKYSWLNFWRNKWLSSLAVSILASSLLLFSLTYLSYVLTSRTVQYLKDKIDISVYFKRDAPKDRMAALKKSLETLGEVKSVEYISSAQALLDFKARHASDKTIAASLAELGENPLEPSLNIKARDLKDYSQISSYLGSSKFKDIIDKITYAQNQIVISKFTKIVKSVEKGAILIGLILIFITIAVTFNTIRLIIYSARKEIEIMRLVGASDFFIRGPFLFTGAMYGVLASLISTFLVFLVVKFSSVYIVSFVPSIDIYKYFLNNFFGIFAWQIVIGIVLGGLSSLIAAKRYLNT